MTNQFFFDACFWMSVLQLQYIEGYVENLRKGQNRLGYTVNINLLRQGSTPPNFSNSPKILIQTVTEFVADLDLRSKMIIYKPL